VESRAKALQKWKVGPKPFKKRKGLK